MLWQTNLAFGAYIIAHRARSVGITGARALKYIFWVTDC